jgi:flagellar hook-length control protein FliK
VKEGIRGLMKIEDSPYHFNGASPVDKLRRTSQSSALDAAFDNYDLSFLDLLTSVVSENLNDAVSDTESADETTKEKSKAAAATESKEKAATPKLSLVTQPTSTEESAASRVEQDMVMFKDEMTDIDVQYMKQAVIPGLPILVGSVPFSSVFPGGTDDQEISYRGFDISPKLAELIEKGYRTGRPIRVELDANSSVVLKIRNGQVSAEFVSNNQAAAFAMQHELDDLRNRMAARNLPVGLLEYKYRDPQQSGQNPNRQSDDWADD